MVNSRYAPDRYAGGHLQDRLSAAFGSALPCAARNKDDIVCLELHIWSLCGQNLLKGEGNILWASRSLADEPGSVQSGVGIGALSEGDGLQYRNIVAIFHNKTAGLVDVA